MKVITVVGTRPELIKLSCVIHLLDDSLEHIFVHTGQNYDYELNGIFFDELGIRKPDIFLDITRSSYAEFIANLFPLVDNLIDEYSPDAFLILGDTNSCLSAIVAKRRHIPIFHMEAGNRCFDSRVPEETNRKIVDHVSDVNLVYTEHARRYLIQEGCRRELIIKTGSPMKEVLKKHIHNIASSTVLSRFQLSPKKYFLVSAHREENVDSKENLTKLISSLELIQKDYQLPIIVSTHPRTRKRLEGGGITTNENKITFVAPLGFFDYIHLQQYALCVISDSGTITEESSLLNFPAITIRQAHERPEGMDEGCLIMSGLEPFNMLNALKFMIKKYEERKFKAIVQDYDVDSVSDKVLQIILSYTHYVNRVTYYKDA